MSTLTKIVRNRSWQYLTNYAKSSMLHAEHTTQSKRFLFSESELRLNEFAMQRATVQDMYGDMLDKLKNDLEQKLADTSTNCVLEGNVRNIIYCVEDNSRDLQLFHNTVERFVKFNERHYFGNKFNLGANVMRTYHQLKRPKEALDIYNSKNVGGIFRNVASHLILMDLLYKTAHYQEILDVMNIYSSIKGIKDPHPLKLVYLSLTSCYQMNTPESYEYGLNLLRETGKSPFPLLRNILIMMKLALNQNKPDDVFEIFKMIRNTEGKMSDNLKIMAYAKLDKLENCFSLLDTCLVKSYPVFDDAAEEMGNAIERKNDHSSTRKFEQYLDSLKLSNLLLSVKIDDVLLKSSMMNSARRTHKEPRSHYLSDSEE